MGCGREIRKYLAETGLTQAQLAAKAGVSKPTIENLARDLHGPSVETAKRLAKVLGCEPWDLLKDAAS